MSIPESSRHRRTRSLHLSHDLGDSEGNTRGQIIRPEHPSAATLLTSLPSDIDLTLRNLRFLDFNQRTDWPELDRETFSISTSGSASKSRSRVQAGEWVLFRLLEQHDPRDTGRRLQHLFPALQPRQSAALRDALFQTLTDLRSAGVLPRDCVLRRSMLDECRGERFVELLFHLSSTVLRSHSSLTHQKMGTFSQPLKDLVTTDSWTDTSIRRAQPLVLALQASVAATTNRRTSIRKRIGSLHAALDFRGQALKVQMERDSFATKALDRLLYESNIHSDTLTDRLRSACEANLPWMNLSTDGQDGTARDAWHDAPFTAAWSHSMAGLDLVSSEKHGDSATSAPDIFGDLERRVSGIKDRLENWKAFQATLSLRNEEFTVLKSPSKTPAQTPNRPTTRHVSKRSVSKVKISDHAVASPQLQATSPSRSRADAPINQLRRTTRSIATPATLTVAAPDAKPRPETGVPRGHQIGNDNRQVSPNFTLAASPLDSPASPGKAMAFRLGDATNANNPAAHSLNPGPSFSPATDTQNRIEASFPPTPPAELSGQEDVSLELDGTARTFTIVRPYLPNSVISLGAVAGLGLDHGPPHHGVAAATNAAAAAAAAAAASVDSAIYTDEAGHTPAKQQVQLEELQGSGSRPTLAERARQSMALVDALQTKRLAYLASASHAAETDGWPRDGGGSGSQFAKEPHTSRGPAEHGTDLSLSERVRASMGHRTTLGATDRPASKGLEAGSHPDRARRHRKTPSAPPPSSSARVGASQDPRADAGTLADLSADMKAMSIQAEAAEAAGGANVGTAAASSLLRPSTPTEQLLSSDADYASVFKSRSRMRRSPPPAAAGAAESGSWHG